MLVGDDGTSLGPAQPGSTRYSELRRQLDALKDELLQAETQRDDFKIKSNQQEKDIISLQIKVEELYVGLTINLYFKFNKIISN